MIKWPSVMYVKPGTTNTAWMFLTMFLKKKMSPGSVNHVPQYETLPSILLYIEYTQVWPHVLITNPSSLSLMFLSLGYDITTCITAYIYLLSLSPLFLFIPVFS